MSLAERLEGARELMDAPGLDREELAGALRDLAWINRRFGNVRMVLARLGSIIDRLSTPAAEPVSILDVATGFADIPRAIALWAREKGRRVEVVAVDRQEQVVELAREASRGFPEVRIERGDALALPFGDSSFDITIASQVLHHMEGEEPVRFLRELHRVARRAALVADLRRGFWPFAVTWTALRVVSRNRFIRFDGPLSIRRAFTAGELRDLAVRAGWERAEVARHAFFRLALVARKD